MIARSVYFPCTSLANPIRQMFSSWPNSSCTQPVFPPRIQLFWLPFTPSFRFSMRCGATWREDDARGVTPLRRATFSRPCPSVRATPPAVQGYGNGSGANAKSLKPAIYGSSLLSA